MFGCGVVQHANKIADAAQHANAFFVIHAISTKDCSKKNFARFFLKTFYRSEDKLCLSNLSFLPEVESRTQGSRPRPRTQKISQAKDSPYEDRPSRGQEQECSRPRTKDTGASVLQKKGLQNNFFNHSKKEKYKKGFRKFSARFLALSN